MALPQTKIKPTRSNPRRLIIYGKPKCGKTTLVSQLENTLILDLERGSDYVDACKVYILGLKPVNKETPEQVKARQEKLEYYMSEIITEIRAEKAKGNVLYKRIVIDTLSKLEDWCEDEATITYMNTEQGKKFNRDAQGNVLPKAKWESVLTLSRGLGYYYLRMVFMNWLDVLDSLAEDTIYICHVKEKETDKNGKMISSTDLQLTGKIGSIISASSDAIAYCYKKGNEVMFNFASSDDACGSRCEHLSGQELVMSEKDDDGKITTYWDKVYVDKE